MSQEDSWEKLAAAGETHWREARYPQALTILSRASDLALAGLDLPELSRISVLSLSSVSGEHSMTAEIDIGRLSCLARALAQLGSSCQHLNEAGAAETAFQRSVTIITYLIVVRPSDIVGEIQAFADLLSQCGRADLAQAISDRMGAIGLEILG